MKKKLEEIKENIPEDFESSLKALANTLRLQISLLLKQKTSQSFSDIARSIKRGNSLVANHIKKLELAGIVQNYIDSNSTSRKYSFYELTPFGKTILTTILKSYQDFYKIEDIGNEIPEELIHTLKGFQKKFRISLALLLKDSKELSFKNIFDYGNIPKSAITNHLKNLELAGVIQNYYKKKENSNEYSFYQITEYGRKMLTELINSYNNYFNKREQNKTNKILFKGGSGSWALPNEKILGWIRLSPKYISKIEMHLSNNLNIKKILNFNAFKKEKKKITLNLSKEPKNYIGFEFYSQKPKEFRPIIKESIRIIAYDKNLNVIKKEKLDVNILKPIIELKVSKNKISNSSGLFEIELTISQSCDLKIEDIEVKAKNKNNKRINIKSKNKDPLKIGGDIPPSVKFDNIIGGFEIRGKGIFQFSFRVLYSDLLGNKYYSNVEKVELKNIEEFEANLDYKYIYPKKSLAYA